MLESDPNVDNLALVIVLIMLGVAIFALYWVVNS